MNKLQKIVINLISSNPLVSNKFRNKLLNMAGMNISKGVIINSGVNGGYKMWYCALSSLHIK